MAQGAGGALLDGDWHYDIASDAFVGVTGLNLSVLDDLETLAGTATDTEVFWQNVVRMVEFSIGVDALDSGDETALADAIYNSNNSLSLSGIVNSLDYAAEAQTTTNGTSGNDTLNGGSGRDILNGGNGHDTLNGNAGNDTLNGGHGDDILTGGTGSDYLSGGDHNDTYVYALGDGVDVIYDALGTDKILFGAGIDLGDLTFSRVGPLDMRIMIDTGSQTGEILVEDMFSTYNGIETIEFSDTSTFALNAQNWTLNGTDGNDTLYGIQWNGGANDTIYGGAGNDTIDGHDGTNTLYGEAGNDTIIGGTGVDTIYGGDGNDVIAAWESDDVIHAGAGNDTVNGGSGSDAYHYTSGHDVYTDYLGADSITLAPGYSSGTTAYYKIGNDLKIVFDLYNSITIASHYNVGWHNAIESLIFDGGPTINLTTVSAVVQGDGGNNTLNGTSNADTLYGFGGNDTLNGNNGDDFLYGGVGNDSLYGGNGNDTLSGDAGDDYLSGGANDDTYYYVSGLDSINESSGTDTLVMAPGWSLNDLTFSRYSTAVNNLVIEINSANRITLQGQAAFAYAAVETLQFSGGPTISFYDIQFTTHGTESNNTLNGLSYGGSPNDIIYGYGGNDTLYGWEGNDTLYGGDGNDTLYGGNGNDLYVFDGGLDTIWENSGTDTLWITNGVTINDISIVNHSTANIKVIVDSGVDEVIISNFRSTSAGYKVEYITFDDGFTADLLTHASWTWGTGGGDTMTGTSGANTLIGLDGNDTIDGAGGNDSIHGGAGDDVLYGGDGNDLLHGGVGDDVLYGGAGTDTLYGGAGADTFVFEEASAFSNVDVIADFSIVQGDVIDLSDLLGLYDPLNDAISDFVVMTEGGGNSMVFVDRDGLGGMYGLEQVATVQGVTGLSDVDTLVAQNVLVVV